MGDLLLVALLLAWAFSVGWLVMAALSFLEGMRLES